MESLKKRDKTVLTLQQQWFLNNLEEKQFFYSFWITLNKCEFLFLLDYLKYIKYIFMFWLS